MSISNISRKLNSFKLNMKAAGAETSLAEAHKLRLLRCVQRVRLTWVAEGLGPGPLSSPTAPACCSLTMLRAASYPPSTSWY